MKQVHNLEILINYIFRLMPDASNEEFRLTVYLLSIFLFTNQRHCWIYQDELINGRDRFLGYGKREAILRGTGLSKKQMRRAVDEVNSRGIIKIEPQSHSHYFFKIFLNAKPLKLDYFNFI